MSTKSPELLKVSATTKPELLAGAIASIVRRGGPAEVHAVGAAAVNQAVKAVAIARGYTAAMVPMASMPSTSSSSSPSGSGRRPRVVADSEALTNAAAVVMPCAAGPAAVPSRVVQCSECGRDCWLSKYSGDQTLALAALLGRRETARIICADCAGLGSDG